MTKINFLLSLHDKLSGLPRKDVEERLSFYSEMIEDRMEEGLSEEEAVAAVGSLEEIAAQIAADIPCSEPSPEKSRSKGHLRVWEIVLLILGSPVWVSLLIAGFSVVLSLYVSLWAVVISLWAVFGSLAICSLAGITVGIGFICSGSITGLAILGTGILCAGLSVFLFWGCKAATKGTCFLAAIFVRQIKVCFAGKEKNHG